jgi:uncharacterized protein
MFGLKNRDIEYIKTAIEKFPEIISVTIFGSRAMGNYKEASDIDIAIETKTDFSDTAIRLSVILNEELPIPFFVDVVDMKSIKNKALIEHIKIEGKVFPLL